MKRRSRKRSKSTAFGRRLVPAFSTTFIGVLPDPNYRGFRRASNRLRWQRPAAFDSLPPARPQERTGHARWIANREPKAAPTSDGRCRASRTCASCAAPGDIPTTFRCRDRPTPCSCARRTRMPTIKRIDTAAARENAGRDRGADRRGLRRRRAEGRDAARQSGRRDRHQGPRLRAGEAPGARRAAVSAGDRPRALSGRSGGGGGGGERARRARRRRGGRGRIRGAARGDRRARGRRRRADLAVGAPTTSRSIRISATPPRCGRRSTRPISWSSRPSSTSASSTARWSRAPASPPTTRRRIPTR